MLNHSVFLFWIAALTIGSATFAAASDLDELTYVEGSTTKVCQSTGDFDVSLGVPTLSQTGKRFGILATDLGSSFEHRGKLYFLFGDTWGRPGDKDILAWTTAKTPKSISLDCWLAPDGKWSPPTVPGISQGTFEVPTGGVSIGGRMYVVFTTDHSAEKTMGRSVLAVSQDDGKTFQKLYALSTSKFINVSFRLTREWLYIFGSGDYRKSSVYLARIKPGAIDDQSKLQYFTGDDEHEHPGWSSREDDAVPLFRHDVVGELSVAYCKPVRRYVMLYNSYAPNGIIMRSAVRPWGPWSAGTIIFEPSRDNAYGKYMHISSESNQKSDALSDVNREAVSGDAYGPFIVNRFTSEADGNCRLYYTMSTWNPYQVVLMRSDIKLEPCRAPANNNSGLPE